MGCHGYAVITSRWSIRYTYIRVFYVFSGVNMPKTKVTSKFQVTIPKEVREKVGVRPGEVVSVESVSDEEIVIRRFRRVKDPLKVLVGKTPSVRRVPVEEFEEKAETR